MNRWWSDSHVMHLLPSPGSTVSVRPFEPVLITLTVSSRIVARLLAPDDDNRVNADDEVNTSDTLHVPASLTADSETISPPVRACLWTNLPFSTSSPDAVTCADDNTVWREIPLTLKQVSFSGDLVFQMLLFVPPGRFECTAFASSTTASASTTWLSGYGDNLVLCSNWCEVTQPAPTPVPPLFQTAVLTPASFGGNLAALPGPANECRRPVRQRVFIAPWFAGRYNEAATCELLTRLTNILADKLACAKPNRSPPNSPNAFAVSPAAASFAGIMTACVLMQHIDPSLMPVGDVDLLVSVASVVAEALRCHGMPNVVKVIQLCTGYTGEKVNDVLASFDSVAGGQQSHTFDFGTRQFPHALSGDSGAQGRCPASSRLSEAVMIVLRWSLTSVPALRDLLGAFHGALTMLALEIADAVMDAHRWHAVVPKTLHVLIQSMVVIPTVANATQRIIVSNMIMKLLGPSATMPSSPSPVLVSSELLTLLAPPKVAGIAAVVTDEDVRKAFASAVASTLLDTVDSMQDIVADHYSRETEPTCHVVVPLEALMGVIIRLHQAHCSVLSRSGTADVTMGRGSCQPLPVASQPASLLESGLLGSPPTRTRSTGEASLTETSTLIPSSLTDARSKVLSFTPLSGEDQGPAAETPTWAQSLTPLTTDNGGISDSVMDMWRKIMVAVVHCAIRIPPHHRDGSVREEYHRVIECCLQLCNWPALVATLLRRLVKTWPHKSSCSHKAVLVDLMMMVVHKFSSQPLCRDTMTVYQALPGVVRVVLRCAQTGSVELARQCIDVLSYSDEKSLPCPMVNRSALTSLLYDRILIDDLCSDKLRELFESHWSVLVRSAAGEALSGMCSGPPVAKQVLAPLPPSPERPGIGPWIVLA